MLEVIPGWYMKQQDRFELNLERNNPYIKEIDTDGWFMLNEPGYFKEVKLTTNILEAQTFNDELKEAEASLLNIFKNSRFLVADVQFSYDY